jgi:hypothetical protein
LTSEIIGKNQARIVIFAHSARIGIDDMANVRDAIAEPKQLVDLLFVLCEN